MPKVDIYSAVPCQVLSEDIISPKGQIIAKAGTPLTDQLILHIKFYNIKEIDVMDEMVAEEEKEDEFVKETMMWRLKHSEEFKEFQGNYTTGVDDLKNIMSDFVNRQTPIDQAKLLDDTATLFNKNSTGISMMNMLLCMKEIDDSTYAHSINVAVTSRVIGMWLGFSQEDLDTLTMCGLLHDVGKCVIPNEILTKPGGLTKLEYEKIKEHPLLGYELIKDQDLNKSIKLAALQHHERYDGTGYPYGITGTQMESFSSIVAIADVYDAMTADRCYREGLCPFDVIGDFQKNAFNLYHPQYVLIFLSRIAESYVNAGCVLSDNRRGKILMINATELTRPLIQLDDGKFVDLRDRLDLYIKAIL